VFICCRIPECGLLQTCLEELATRYPATKFVKIISTDCIPNYPDRNVPTVLVYNNSAVKGTYVGLQKFGGRKCTPECKLLPQSQFLASIFSKKNVSSCSLVLCFIGYTDFVKGIGLFSISITDHTILFRLSATQSVVALISKLP
jgi:hypothetical protein